MKLDGYLYSLHFRPFVLIQFLVDSVSDFHIHRLLDNIFQAMVLLVGLDDLLALRNIDRVKVILPNTASS